MTGLTFDTGVLIAIERLRSGPAEQRAMRVWQRARERKIPITVPTVVVAEWWRGQRGPSARLLDGVTLEPLDPLLAKAAGEALAQVRLGPSVVDAIVMASAARRGDIVYTSDVGDLDALRKAFPSVRVLGI